MQGDFEIFKNIRDDFGSVRSNQTRVAANEDITTTVSKTQSEQDLFYKFIQEARICLEQEEFDKAIKKFEGILALSEGHVEALNGKGVALCKQKKYEEALQCFKEVLKIKPRHPEASTYVDMITDRISKKEDNADVKPSDKVTKQQAELEKRTEEKVIKALDESKQIPTVMPQYLQRVAGADSRNPYNDPTLPIPRVRTTI